MRGTHIRSWDNGEGTLAVEYSANYSLVSPPVSTITQATSAPVIASPEESLAAARLALKSSPTSVLVAVKAVALSPLDAVVRSGAYESLIGSPPVTGGYEFSGVIVAVGSDVEQSPIASPGGQTSWPGWKVGQEVVGMAPLLGWPGGACAEYTLVPGWCLLEKPSKLSFEAAAAIPLSAGFAGHVLHDVLGVESGTGTLLVVNGGGPHGHLVVQLALRFGVRVIATSTSGTNLTWLRELRVKVAHGVMSALEDKQEDGQRPGVMGSLEVIDLRTEALVGRVMELTGGLGVDWIVESWADGRSAIANDIGGGTSSDGLAALLLKVISIGGKWFSVRRSVSLSGAEGAVLHVKGASMAFGMPSIVLARSQKIGTSLARIASALDDAASGNIIVRTSGEYSLSQVKEAHGALESARGGKVIVSV